jgi:hypothetical protein
MDDPAVSMLLAEEDGELCGLSTSGESRGVWSFAANERANAFYERAGFTRDGAEKTEDTWAHLLEVRFRRSL